MIFKNEGTSAKCGVGKRFNVNSAPGEVEEYILANIGHCAGIVQVALISLTNGNRWAEGVPVSDHTFLTREEWYRVCAPSPGLFKEIENVE